MSIGKQLMAMLIIAIVGICVVFTISMSKMDKVYEETNRCNIDSLPSIMILNDLQKNFYSMRVRVWEHVANTDQTKMKAVEQQFYEAKKSFEENSKKYQPYLITEKGKEYFKKFKRVLRSTPT